MTDILTRILARLDDPLENALDPQSAAQALRDVLAEHAPVHRHAAVLADRFGPGHCTFCRDDGVADVDQPRATWQQMMPRYGWSDMHCHGPMSDPWCERCNDGEETTPWPCRTVRRAAELLGLSVDDPDATASD